MKFTLLICEHFFRELHCINELKRASWDTKLFDFLQIGLLNIVEAFSLTNMDYLLLLILGQGRAHIHDNKFTLLI